jgi:transposase-like protein
MRSQTAALKAIGHRFAMPTCPQCGDWLVAPAKAAFAGAGWVRHMWCCEECGYAFRTSVKYGVRPSASSRSASPSSEMPS